MYQSISGNINVSSLRGIGTISWKKGINELDVLEEKGPTDIKESQSKSPKMVREISRKKPKMIGAISREWDKKKRLEKPLFCWE